VIFSHPARVDERARTVARLLERADRPPPAPIVWTGDGAPCPHRPEDCCGLLRGQRQRDVHDFRALIASPLVRGDLLFLEDDVEPCRNALRYMIDWQHPSMTTFYNPGRAVGMHPIEHGFIFSQAFKLPAALVARMRAEPFPAPGLLQRDGIDNIVHRYLKRWGLPFYQHRSLVQHVGEVSTWTTSKLTGNGRRSIDWPGPDVDALTFKWRS